MINSTVAVEARLARGETLSLLTDFAGKAGGVRWVITETCETVRKSVVGRLVMAGAVAPIQHGIDGEPIQYGAPQSA